MDSIDIPYDDHEHSDRRVLELDILSSSHADGIFETTATVFGIRR